MFINDVNKDIKKNPYEACARNMNPRAKPKCIRSEYMKKSAREVHQKYQKFLSLFSPICGLHQNKTKSARTYAKKKSMQLTCFSACDRRFPLTKEPPLSMPENGWAGDIVVFVCVHML